MIALVSSENVSGLGITGDRVSIMRHLMQWQVYIISHAVRFISVEVCTPEY